MANHSGAAREHSANASHASRPEQSPGLEVVHGTLPAIDPDDHQALEFEKVKQITSKISGLIAGEPSFKGNLESDPVKPHSTDLASLLRTIKQSSTALTAVVEASRHLNLCGKATSTRSLDLGKELIPIAVSNINIRGKGKKPIVTQDESRLLHIYSKAHSKQILFPDWFKAIRNTVEAVGRAGSLPNPTAYLAASPKLAHSSTELRRHYDRVATEVQTRRQGSGREDGPDGSNTLAALKKLERLVDRMDHMLVTTGDVSPEDVPECCRKVTIQVIVKPETVEALLDLYIGVGEIIQNLSGIEGTDGVTSPIKCTELIGTAGGGPGKTGVVSRLSRFALDPQPILDEKREENLLFLLEEYAKIHSALVKVYEQWSGQIQAGPDPKRRNILQQMEQELTDVFPGRSKRSLATFIALDGINDPRLRRLLPSLLTQRVVKGGHGQTGQFLDKKENIQLLGQALRHLVTGNEETAVQIEKVLQSTSLRPITDLGRNLRTLLEKGETARLVRLFDDTLKRISGGSYASSTEKTVALHALMVASENEDVRRNLKGRLRNLELVDQIASTLNEGAAEGSAYAQFVETLRARISRRFAPDLSDYWGHRKLVKKWEGMLQDHLSLIEHPESWDGIPPNKVFFNGYLLYGPPRAGKSFLVACMANHLEIPLVIISREEMGEVFRDSAGQDGGSIESTLSTFLTKKIEQAEAEKRKSGSKACMLFIDEMEAEFLRRNPETSPRAELARTNIMLRVLERLIKKHPDIIFAGATNHIDLVDSAALGFGRYGLHLSVGMPEEEDIRDILDGTLAELGIKVNEEVQNGDIYQNFVKDCLGLTPLAISQIVNNTICLQRIMEQKREIPVDDHLLAILTRKVVETKELNYLKLEKEAG